MSRDWCVSECDFRVFCFLVHRASVLVCEQGIGPPLQSACRNEVKNIFYHTPASDIVMFLRAILTFAVSWGLGVVFFGTSAQRLAVS